MAKTVAKKELTRRTEKDAERTATDLATMEPGSLRDWFLRVLGVLSPDEWAVTRNKLLMALDEAGVNLGSSMFILGIPARDSEELTAPELAMLMRYVRINEPNALMDLSEQLMELQRTYRETRAEPTRRAA
jgi:hypothetical protein